MSKMNNKGFSIVEVMIVTVIFMMMVGGLFTALEAGSRSWQASENGVAIVRDARNAMWAMSKDLRKASGGAVTQVNGVSTSLMFVHPTDGSVTYSWVISGGNAKKLIRQTATTSRTLATNVLNLHFTPQATSIKVDLTVSRTPDSGGPSSSMNLVQAVTYR